MWILSGSSRPIENGLIFACLEKQAFDRKSFRQTVENALFDQKILC